MPTTDIRTDNTDSFAWTTITTVHDDDGVIISKTTEYDNSDQTIETFTPESGVVLHRIQLFDNSDTKTYTTIDETFVVVTNAQTGEVFRFRSDWIDRVVTYDDGIVQSMLYYVLNESTGVTKNLKTDTADVKNWATLLLEYDYDGNRTKQETIYDDGARTLWFGGTYGALAEFRFNADGEQTGGLGVYYDQNGKVDEVYYHDVNINGGLFYQKRYEDGHLISVTENDSESMAYDFANRWTQYDPATGNKKSVFTTYDDLTSELVTYELIGSDNNIARTEITDADRNLTAISQRSYDAEGNLAEHQYYDLNVKDGMGFTKSYVDGQLVNFTEEDTTADAVSFERRSTSYDANGAMINRTTESDDGTHRSETWEDGQRRSVETTDIGDIKGWHMLSQYFDESGLLAYKETTYDNDVVRADTYENGVIAQTEQTDPANVQTWTTITTNYDAAGVIEARETVQDDGFLRVDSFEAGKRVAVVRDDLDDVATWDRIETTYTETGDVDVHRIDYDDTDVFIFDKVDGLRIFRDGDGDQRWAFKVTELAGPNGAETTFYDSINDLMIDIAEEFFGF
jgi:hypothetical protein